jgi:hypothetical protein
MGMDNEIEKTAQALVKSLNISIIQAVRDSDHINDLVSESVGDEISALVSKVVKEVMRDPSLKNIVISKARKALGASVEKKLVEAISESMKG